jgi:hypothetical protein
MLLSSLEDSYTPKPPTIKTAGFLFSPSKIPPPSAMVNDLVVLRRDGGSESDCLVEGLKMWDDEGAW